MTAPLKLLVCNYSLPLSDPVKVDRLTGENVLKDFGEEISVDD